MYFNLSQWPSAEELNAETITSAWLDMSYYQQTDWQTGNGINFDVYRVDSAWNSNTITWNNQNDIGGTWISRVSIDDHRQKITGKDSYNVIELGSAPLYKFFIRLRNSGTAANRVRFS